MVKVLITGFKHSGTTLLSNLLMSHPQVGWIEFEKALIEYDKPPQWILDQAKNSGVNLKNQVWGDKLPWGIRENDWKAKRSIAFTKKWIKYFKKDARVLHIIRHPIDVSLSRYPLPKTQHNEIIDKKMMEYYINSVPYYLNYIKDNKYIATVVYEELLEWPKSVLCNVFDFLGIDHNPKLTDKIIRENKINKDRAYAYKAKGVDYKKVLAYDKLLEMIGRKL